MECVGTWQVAVEARGGLHLEGQAGLEPGAHLQQEGGRGRVS